MADRVADVASIRSQAGEGWSTLSEIYDDGGFSGGNMERPAFKRLLSDVIAGKIDVIVVYKVDRLTRSLMDFAKIVDVLDQHGVSFVSVTQAFNTTSSMGRLTLNVLLSFAQFEREVTGERIRDKIAASKAKGIWMGGVVPLGYDSRDRSLVVNEIEAEQVRTLFRRYLELKSVPALKKELDRMGARSKTWTTRRGRVVGGAPFTCGCLFHILTNRLYVGAIVHKGEPFLGQHAPIIDNALFDAAQAQLDENRRRHHRRPTRAANSPLAGLVFDAEDAVMSPSFAYGQQRRLYRYYVSPAVLPGRGKGGEARGQARRVSAQAIENLIMDRLRRLTKDPTLDWNAARNLLLKIQLRDEFIHVSLRRDALAFETPEDLQCRLSDTDRVALTNSVAKDELRLRLPLQLILRGGRTWLNDSDQPVPVRGRINATLLAALRRAHALLADHGASPMSDAGAMGEAQAPAEWNERRITPLAFLAPDIQRAIVEGRQPSGLTLNGLLEIGVPLSWSAQGKSLGFG